MIQDFKFACRQLTKSPGFTAIAVVTPALAIETNSGIFALVNFHHIIGSGRPSRLFSSRSPGNASQPNNGAPHRIRSGLTSTTTRLIYDS